MRLIWSLQAIEDVEAIRTYVARDSEQYANLLMIGLSPQCIDLRVSRFLDGWFLRSATNRSARSFIGITGLCIA